MSTEEGAIPEPSLSRIDYGRPQDYLLLNESLGSEDRIRELAASLRASTTEHTLVSIGRWIQANLKYDSRVDSRWRNFDTALETKLLGSCADHAIVFAALARASGIPTVFVKSMNADWIREFRTRGSSRGWRGHVFLEVFLADRWQLLDAQALHLYEEYDPGMPILPGNRYAYDKGADPKALVLSLEGVRWIRQTTAYFSKFDLAQLPVGEGRPLDAIYIAANSPVYQAIKQRLQALGLGYTTIYSFNTQFDEYLPQAKGHDLIITCVGDNLVLPEAYHTCFLPLPLSELRERIRTESRGVLIKQWEDGTRVALIYAPDLAAIQEAICTFEFGERS
jgi:hypothetical protein